MRCGLIAAIVMAMAMCPCAMTYGRVKAKAPSLKEGEAQFTSFRYAGDDDFYRDRPLLSDSEFYNPILPGWFSDPSIVRRGEDYYLVTSTFGYFPGVPLYHSRDLVNWKLAGNVLDRPGQLAGLAGQSLDKGGIYAPQITYNPANGLFYMITTDVGRQQGHFYVTSANPEDGWSDPVWLENIDGIDPSLFFDDNGEAFIVYKEDTAGKPKWSNYRCIRFIRFDAETGQTSGESWPLREEGVGPEERLDRDEGPHLYKVDGRYYLICAEGGTSTRHSAVIYRADSVRGAYTRWARNPMLTQRHLKTNRRNPVTCAGHADLVQTPEGEWWGVFLGCRPWKDGTQALGRETFLMPVKWSKDGFPYMTQCESDTVPLVLERAGVRRDSVSVSGNFEWSDHFGDVNLAPEWLSLRGSAAQHYTTGYGTLRLRCSEELSTGKGTPAYLGRRVQHHKYSVEADVRFIPGNGRQSAGLMVLKNESRQLYLALDSAGVSVRRIGKDGSVTEVARKLYEPGISAGAPLSLRIATDGLTYGFYYRPLDDDRWICVAYDVDATYVSCERSGGFTGATVGMYAEER